MSWWPADPRAEEAALADYRTLPVASAPPTGFGESFEAAFNDTMMSGRRISRQRAVSDEWRPVTERIHAAGGPRFWNPSLADEKESERIKSEIRGWIDANRDKVPDLPPMDEASVWQRISTRAQEFRGARDRAQLGAGGFSARLGDVAGEAWGSLHDPLTAISIVAGAPRAAGLATTALIEGGLAVTLSLAAQPQLRSFQEQVGLEWHEPSLADLAISGGLAAGLGTAGQAIGRLALGPQGRAAARVAEGEARAADRGHTAAEGEAIGGLVRDFFQRHPDPAVRAAGEALADRERIRSSAPPGTDGLAGVAHVQNLAQAEAALAAGVHPMAVMDAPERAVLSAAPAPAAAPAATPAEAVGPTPIRLGNLARLDPDAIAVDAKRFQFKEGGDAAGVTDRLQGIERWDETRSGKALVWEDEAGKLWIADGHQRLALAKRAKAAGQADVAIDAMVLRQADGITAESASAVAAMKNVAEGTGSAVDAAKVLRTLAGQPELRQRLGGLPPLPPRSALVQDARALARLGDDAFGMVVNRVVPERQAAEVGRMIDDPAEQLAAMQVLARSSPETIGEARAIVEQVRDAGFAAREAGAQGALFGSGGELDSLFADRAKILRAALAELKHDRATFRTLVDKADQIGETGNVLSDAANRDRLDRDQALIAMVARLATVKGPVGDALTEAARAARQGGKVSAHARQFLEAVERAAGAGSIDRALARLAGDGGPQPAPGRGGAGDGSGTASAAGARDAGAGSTGDARGHARRVDRALGDLFGREEPAPTLDPVATREAIAAADPQDAALFADFDRILNETPDLPIAGEVRVTDGQTVAGTRTVRELVDEIAAQERVAREVAACATGAAAVVRVPATGVRIP